MKLRWQKKIVQGTVPGKRKRGRQNKRWEDNIREWTGLDFNSSQRAAEDLSDGRRLSPMSTVVPLRPWWFQDTGKVSINLPATSWDVAVTTHIDIVIDVKHSIKLSGNVRQVRDGGYLVCVFIFTVRRNELGQIITSQQLDGLGSSAVSVILSLLSNSNAVLPPLVAAGFGQHILVIHFAIAFVTYGAWNMKLLQVWRIYIITIFERVEV